MPDLPANVSVRKTAKPKGFGYPLQTTELVQHLGLDKLSCPVGIYYCNSPERRDTISIMEVRWMGKQVEPYFHITIHAVPSKLRKKFNAAFASDAAKHIKKWMTAIPKDIGQKRKQPQLFLVCRRYSWYKYPKVVLHQDYKQDFMEKEIDLEGYTADQ